jgi:LmbE family N-acetylglucosaminyl deacetylase
VLSLPLGYRPEGTPLRVLAVGAHADDVEIGSGGTLLSLAESGPLEARVIVMSANPERAAEARTSAAAFLAGATYMIDVHDLPDGRLPGEWDRVKAILEASRATWSPDIVLCPSKVDAHQDHRLLGDLMSTVFRNHLVLQYEIPKWDGDLGRRSTYVPLTEDLMRRKVELLDKCFRSQHGRDWFDEEVFRGLARLRGMECRAPYAEAFGCDKLLLLPWR